MGVCLEFLVVKNYPTTTPTRGLESNTFDATDKIVGGPD